MNNSIHCGIFVLDATVIEDNIEHLAGKILPMKTLLNEKSTSAYVFVKIRICSLKVLMLLFFHNSKFLNLGLRLKPVCFFFRNTDDCVAIENRPP